MVPGVCLISAAPKPDGDAETYYQRSLALSRRQGAMSWELRTSIDLAALKADIDVGLADIAAGRVNDFDPASVIERGRKLLAAR